MKIRWMIWLYSTINNNLLEDSFLQHPNNMLIGFYPWFISITELSKKSYLSQMMLPAVFYNLPSLIVCVCVCEWGGGQLKNFKFFPPTSIYYHPSHFAKILKNPSTDYCHPPNLSESSWKKIFSSSGRFLSSFF